MNTQKEYIKLHGLIGSFSVEATTKKVEIYIYGAAMARHFLLLKSLL